MAPIVPYVDPEALFARCPEAERFRDRVTRMNITRMWANAPQAFVAGLPLADALIRNGVLEGRLKELLILAVTRIEGGVYPFTQHILGARREGCSDAQITALEAGDLDSPLFDAREKAMFALAREVIRDVRASEAVVEAAKAWFDQHEIVEIILTTGFYMTMARLTETTRVEIDAPPGVNAAKFERLE